jgi:hypothetical protein
LEKLIKIIGIKQFLRVILFQYYANLIQLLLFFVSFGLRSILSGISKIHGSYKRYSWIALKNTQAGEFSLSSVFVWSLGGFNPHCNTSF